MPKRVSLAELRDFLERYWGWTLTRNGGPGSIPWQHSAWTTGWTLSGHFPGRGYDHIRYNSLQKVAEQTEYYEHVEEITE